MPASRQARLESLLHREIATTIQQELRDPRLGFITVTRVTMTSDLHQVRAYFTVLGDIKARRLAAQALDHAKGFIQSRYAPALKTRLVPLLTFVYDETERKRGDIEDLIRKARASDTDHGAHPEPPSAEAQGEAERWKAPRPPGLEPVPEAPGSEAPGPEAPVPPGPA